MENESEASTIEDIFIINNFINYIIEDILLEILSFINYILEDTFIERIENKS